jgi:hypothetical protein
LASQPWLPPFFYSAANKLDLMKKILKEESGGLSAEQTTLQRYAWSKSEE